MQGKEERAEAEEGAEAVASGSKDADTSAGDSLGLEMRAAADAMAAHVRKVAATASTEAELSITSLVAIAIAALTSLLLAVAAWLCIIAAVVWLAVSAGLTMATALFMAAGVNVIAVLLLLLWGRSLLGNIGFARTRKLIFPESG